MLELHFIAAALAAGLVSAFLRSFQNKNVQADLKWSAFGTGWLMGLADAATFLLIADQGILLGLFTGLGIGLGYVLGMVVHNKLMAKRDLLRKQKKKSKLDDRIETVVKQYLKDTV